jgi:hypothetical protein
LGFRGLLSLRVRLLPRQPHRQPLLEGTGPPAG